MNSLANKSLKILEVSLILMMISLVLVVLWGVIGRFILSASPRWTEEVATFLLAWLSLLGAVVAFARKQHLGVDVLVNRLSPFSQNFCRIVTQILIMLFCLSVFVYGGTILVWETLSSGQVTPALGLRMGLVYLIVPISGVLFVLIALKQTWEILYGELPARTVASQERGTE